MTNFEYAFFWAQDLWSTVLHARARQVGYVLACRWCFMTWVGEMKRLLKAAAARREILRWMPRSS